MLTLQRLKLAKPGPKVSSEGLHVPTPLPLTLTPPVRAVSTLNYCQLQSGFLLPAALWTDTHIGSTAVYTREALNSSVLERKEMEEMKQEGKERQGEESWCLLLKSLSHLISSLLGQIHSYK